MCVDCSRRLAKAATRFTLTSVFMACSAACQHVQAPGVSATSPQREENHSNADRQQLNEAGNGGKGWPPDLQSYSVLPGCKTMPGHKHGLEPLSP